MLIFASGRAAVAGRALVALTALASAVAAQAPLFEGPKTPLAGATNALAVGDFDGDGRPDVLTTFGQFPPAGVAEVQLALGRGDGTFNALPVVAVSDVPNDVAVGDFDGDGDLDAAVCDGNVDTLAGDGHGGLALSGSIDTPAFASFVAVGDLDGDGDADLVVGADALTVLVGDGRGGFAPGAAVGSGCGEVALGDFDGDGDLEAVAAASGALISRFDGDGEGGFAAPASLGYGHDLRSLVVADLDGNGLPDVAMLEFGTNRVQLLLSQSGVPWDYGPPLSVGVGGASALVIGDVLEDGHPDLLVVGSSSFGLIAGDGLGDFAPVVVDGSIDTDQQIGVSLIEAALLDANGDGHLDVAVNSPYSKSLTLVLGHGQGLPDANGRLEFPGSRRGVVVRDLDGDGVADLASATVAPDRLDVLRGLGGGSFAPPISTASGLVPRGLVSEDFNADGLPDLAMSCAGSDAVQLMMNGGGLNFTAHALTPTGTDPLHLVALDLDLDGLPDVATADSNGKRVSVLLGDGTGSLAAALGIALPSNPIAIFAGDVNLDGAPDLLVDTATKHLLLGDGHGGFVASTAITGQPRALADFDGDGDLDIVSAGTSGVSVWPGNGAGAFGAPTVSAPEGAGLVVACSADFDGDGAVDLAGSAAQLFVPSLATLILHGSGDGSFTVNGHFTALQITFEIVAGDFDDDGALDIASTNSLPSDSVLLLRNRRLDPDFAWTDLGHGLAGAAGVPRLVGSGTLQLSSTGSLVLSGAAPGKPALLFLSTSIAAAPFKGGQLVPVPVLALVPLSTGSAGGLTLSWPTFHAGFSGLSLVAQYGIADASAVHGVALSNAVAGLVP